MPRSKNQERGADYWRERFERLKKHVVLQNRTLRIVRSRLYVARAAESTVRRVLDNLREIHGVALEGDMLVGLLLQMPCSTPAQRLRLLARAVGNASRVTITSTAAHRIRSHDVLRSLIERPNQRRWSTYSEAQRLRAARLLSYYAGRV